MTGAAAYFSQLDITAVSLCGKIRIKICTKNELDMLMNGELQSTAIFGEMLKNIRVMPLTICPKRS